MKPISNTTENMTAQPGMAPRLDKVLVVISPDLLKPGAPKESTLITRAIALAKATGCQLELFHVCHDSSMTPVFFRDDDEFRLNKQKVVDRDAMLVAELILQLKNEGVSISSDTRWDTPRTDAILRKIEESRPDMVMKQSRQDSYVMGLVGNTDWDLIRQSPVHLWFVTEGGSNRIDRFITAVGASDDSSEMIAAADYDVFRMASVIAKEFDAENVPVHAYQVPLGITAYAAYAPDFGGLAYPHVGPVSIEEKRREVAKDHGRSIEAFAEFFHLDPEQVQVVEGHPADVLPEVAESLGASLIVMAARNLSSWDRFFKPVTAEPVLAEGTCDVLYVKHGGNMPLTHRCDLPRPGKSAEA